MRLLVAAQRPPRPALTPRVLRGLEEPCPESGPASDAPCRSLGTLTSGSESGGVLRWHGVSKPAVDRTNQGTDSQTWVRRIRADARNAYRRAASPDDPCEPPGINAHARLRPRRRASRTRSPPPPSPSASTGRRDLRELCPRFPQVTSRPPTDPQTKDACNRRMPSARRSRAPTTRSTPVLQRVASPIPGFGALHDTLNALAAPAARHPSVVFPSGETQLACL